MSVRASGRCRCSARLVPLLQFDDVSLGVGQIDERDSAGAGDVGGNQIANASAAGCEHRVSGCFDVVNLEGEMRQTRTIDCCFRPLLGSVVLEYLEGRPVITITREPQMNAADLGARHTCTAFDPFSNIGPLRRNWNAAENLLVELSELSPVLGNDVCVFVFGLGHFPAEGTSGGGVSPHLTAASGWKSS